ncbi:MAG: hypothetical protein VKP62_01485 [Candidatus Sericytochromatia bacterium]|nr:hypothetical protein [Candidatus Sericytochromatia bacterium]
MVSRLESEFAGQVRVRRIVLDRLKPGTPEHLQGFAWAEALALERTPTYVLVTPQGQVRARFEGVTPYLSLRAALVALATPAPALP